jgi:membrane peptidoglycan carboxypeptidase
MKNPPSSRVAILSGITWRKNKKSDKRIYKLLEISLSWRIESETSQKECLNWLMEKSDFLYNSVGIKQASEFYFKKGISELNERELASLVIMANNPSLYNPLRRRKLLEEKVEELLKKNKSG